MLFGTWSQAHAYDPSDYMETRLKMVRIASIGLEHVQAVLLCLGLHMAVMIVNIDLSQEILGIDMLRALKSSLKHRRKHVLRPLQLYGDQAQYASIQLNIGEQ